MKPCRKYRRQIVLLEMKALEPPEAETVRQHLGDCAACQGYAEEISKLAERLADQGPLPAAQPANQFHRRWMQRISHRSQPNWNEGWPAGLRLLGEMRTASAVAALVLGLVVLAALYGRRSETARQPEPLRPKTFPSAVLAKAERPLSLGAYHRVADVSLDALDQLLNRQARIAAAGESYRVSSPVPD